MPSNIQQSISPENSAWISASAGTGKTKILTDRILNLLLNDIRPNNILCLTFTKAAKGEMLTRISDKLFEISNLSINEIKNYIFELTNNKISSKEAQFAKDYYHNYTKQDVVLGVYTIHAFCQSILQKFPLESGLNTSFEVIDEIDRKKILSNILTSHDFVKNYSDNIKKKTSIFSLNNYLIDCCNYISYKNYKNFEDVSHVLEKNIKNISINESEIINQINSKHFIEVLSKFKPKEYEQIIAINNKKISKNLSDYYFIFLNKTGDIKKTFITKKIRENCPDFSNEYELIQNILYEYNENLKKKELIEINLSILKFAFDLATKYTEYKNKNNLLDYNDLIIKTNQLLSKSDHREWIKYKLDGGVEHILVDESQDTSEIQWAIIEELIEEFFAGENSRDKEKTIFVVGDIKQSIYSFQGARPDLFNKLKQKIKTLANNSSKKFIDLNLSKTYRLPYVINNYVKKIFEKKDLFDGLNELTSAKEDQYSRIELWPLIKKEVKSEYFWPTPNELEQTLSSEKKLARKIAEFIKDLIDKKHFLDSQNRSVIEDDFLILVQKRSTLSKEIFSELQAKNIKISGSDRLILNRNIVVQDILSALNYIRNPHNKFNLASLLKSFFFNISDLDIKKYVINNLDLPEDIISKLKKIKKINRSTNISKLIFTLATEFSIFNFLQSNSLYNSLESLKSLIDKTTTYLNKSSSNNIINLIEYIENSEIHLKRELSRDEGVKIMTAHGSKGLESPIIILADSNDISLSLPNSYKLVVNENIEIPIWNFGIKTKFTDNIRSNENIELYNEYLRLFYVALTRTKDYLVISGIENSKSNDLKTWYNISSDVNIQYNEDNDIKFLESNLNNTSKFDNSETDKNYYLISSSYPDNSNHKYENKEYNFSNISAQIGITYHKLLEYYFKKIDRFEQFVDIEISKYPENISTEIKINIFKSINNNKINDIFNYKYFTEIELSEEVNSIIHNMRIDLLVEKEKHIEIIDFKSDSYISDIHENQLKNYYKICKKIYPNKDILCFIYWIKDNKWEEYKYYE